MSDTTHEAPELLPCPFCGGKPYLSNVEMAGCAYVVCTDCRMQSDDGSQQKVVTKWNTRADLVQAAAAAALREAAKSLADRAEGERQASIYFKEKGRDYKAREAAHVARLMGQHVPYILALITPDAQAALDRVVAAERERCAKVVEAEGMHYAGLREGTILDRVAAAIRKGGE